MDVVTGILTVSILLNILWPMALGIGMGVRYLRNLTKTWCIGLNGPIRVERIKARHSRVSVMGEKGATSIDMDPMLVKTTSLGQPVMFYDQATMQQIAPYGGLCVNDNEDLTWVDENGRPQNIGLQWRRICGEFLNAKRRSINIDKLTDEDTGIFGFLSKAMPMLTILIVILMIGMMFMLGSGGVA